MKRRRPGPSKLALDKLCREVTFERDEHQCVRCGNQSRLQWCHVVTRGVPTLRHRMENVLTLCSGCHLWNHHHPTAFSQWWGGKYPERAKALALMRPGGRVDPEATRLYLLSLRAS